VVDFVVLSRKLETRRPRRVSKLTKRCASDSMEKLSGAVAGAQVGRDGRVNALVPFIGKSGWLTLSAFTVESLDQAEDHLIFGAVTDDGTPLDEECAARATR
jgi:hypothetical protein